MSDAVGGAGDERASDDDCAAPRAVGRRPRVKICGITRERDRDVAVAAGADAVGVVCEVSVDTPREVDEEAAATLVGGVAPLVTSVLVTMPRTVEHATGLVRSVEPDAVQVHGGLSPDELGALGRRLSRPVIAAVDAEAGMSGGGDVPAYAEAADALLVDSADAGGGGGTGRTHDWKRTRELVADLDVPVILAGGLAPSNVAEAVDAVDPFGVDVATGVERDGGIKDHDEVRRFVDLATGADAQ